jgi:hypothetical protein
MHFGAVSCSLSIGVCKYNINIKFSFITYTSTTLLLKYHKSYIHNYRWMRSSTSRSWYLGEVLSSLLLVTCTYACGSVCVCAWLWVQCFVMRASQLINSKQLIPSWEPASCAATKEFPNILWNPKVHYHVHSNPPLVPNRRQINPVHSTPSYVPKIYFNIIHTPTSRSF